MSEPFKNAMAAAYEAGWHDHINGGRGYLERNAKFEVFFANFLKDIERKAREDYEAPIRLTPNVTLPGPDWNELDEKVRNAFRIPPEMIGMDFGTESPVVAVNDWPDDVRETCTECEQTGIPIVVDQGKNKCPWCGAVQ